jgi:hypothetical protein
MIKYLSNKKYLPETAFGKDVILNQINLSALNRNIKKSGAKNHYCPVKNKLTNKYMMNVTFEVC